MKTSPIQVTLIDRMGTDLTVCNAARVSFAKESTWVQVLKDGYEAIKKLSDADVKLIAYLAKHDHWSPFAHTSVQFRVKAPIFVARQLVKHTVGGVWNEESRRYIDSEPEFYLPRVWHKRPDGSIKQGAGLEHPDSDLIAQIVHSTSYAALRTYNGLLSDGVAPEEARMVLPLNTHTEWIWTGSLMFWARVCKLRLDPHAQSATGEVAQQIDAVMSGLYPVSWRALMKDAA
jgi:thymidylate synthase (FAD)